MPSALTRKIKNHISDSLIDKQRILIIFIQDRLNISMKSNTTNW